MYLWFFVISEISDGEKSDCNGTTELNKNRQLLWMSVSVPAMWLGEVVSAIDETDVPLILKNTFEPITRVRIAILRSKFYVLSLDDGEWIRPHLRLSAITEKSILWGGVPAHHYAARYCVNSLPRNAHVPEGYGHTPFRVWWPITNFILTVKRRNVDAHLGECGP